MLTREQNERLTRIEDDAPMGTLMREHCWIPAALSVALVADGAPRRVRLLGTDYVAFRDSNGEIGFLDERCPHRNVSLVLARNEDCALTCIFHAWRIDVTGQVVDAPTHTPNAEAFAAKVKTRSYPVVEGGGMVWVWLGEGEAPPFPHLPFTVLPQSQVWVTTTTVDCNWLQGVEATLDTAHIGTLHKAYIAAYSQADDESTIGGSLANLAPRYDVERTSYGLDAIASRPLPDGTNYVRTTKHVLPFVSLVPGSAGDVDGVIFIVSPVDDTRHVMFHGFWSNTKDINNGFEVPTAQLPMMGNLPYDVHEFGKFTAGRDENWGQDREAMARGHFTGFTGNLLQEDTVTQVSMGPIVDRTKEHLSSSDVAIIHLRRQLLQVLDDLEAGSPPVPAESHLSVVPTDEVLAPH